MNLTTSESNNESLNTAILRCDVKEVDTLSVCSTQSLSSEKLANEDKISATNRSVANADNSEFSTVVNDASSDVVVVMNGRILSRPPLLRANRRIRSATPIRILRDPLRSIRNRSISLPTTGRRSRSAPIYTVAADEMTAARTNVNNQNTEDTLDNMLIQRARLRVSRRPMYDGDSRRNMPERRFDLANNLREFRERMARIRLLSRALTTTQNGNESATSNADSTNANNDVNSTVNDVAVSNNRMEPETAIIDRHRPSIPLPPPLPPPGLLQRPMITIFLRPSPYDQEQQEAEQPSSNAMLAEQVMNNPQRRGRPGFVEEATQTDSSPTVFEPTNVPDNSTNAPFRRGNRDTNGSIRNNRESLSQIRRQRRRNEQQQQRPDYSGPNDSPNCTIS